MNAQLNEEATRYFFQKASKIYVNIHGKIENFEEYLNHGYIDNYNHCSLIALMGLNCDDYIVSGSIEISKEIPIDLFKRHSYSWIEFKFNNEEYVFDSKLNCVCPKKEWEKTFNPKVTSKISQDEILDKYLNDEFAIELTNGLWQFKKVNNINTGYILNTLSLSQIRVSTWQESECASFIMNSFGANPNEKVQSFIAYVEQNE